MKRNDMFIGVYLMAAVIFFIIPMPSLLLDILIALNLSVSLIILFSSLFAKEALEMSSFPTLLLPTPMRASLLPQAI